MHFVTHLWEALPVLGSVLELVDSLRNRGQTKARRRDLRELAQEEGWPVGALPGPLPPFRVGRVRERRAPVDVNFSKANLTLDTTSDQTQIYVGLFEVHYVQVTAYAIPCKTQDCFQIVIHRSLTALGSERGELQGMDPTDFHLKYRALQTWLAEHAGWGLSLSHEGLICYQFAFADETNLKDKLREVVEVKNLCCPT